MHNQNLSLWVIWRTIQFTIFVLARENIELSPAKLEPNLLSDDCGCGHGLYIGTDSVVMVYRAPKD